MRAFLRSAVILLALLFTGIVGTSQQGPDLPTVVAQFYPESLDADLALIGADTTVRRQCYAVLESDAQGSPQTILAAYANIYSGAVRVLRRTAGGFEVAADSAGELLMGAACEVKAIDIDGDGRLEAHVKFAIRRNTADWIYAWQNSVLSNLTPGSVVEQTGEVDTAIHNATLIDLNGDGVMELFSFNPPSNDSAEAVPASEVFRLSAGSYVLDRPVVTMWPLQRGDGTPTTETITVRRPTGAVGPFTLRVLNGAGGLATGQRVENAVESGRVWLNGQEIVRPNDFGNQVAVIERTVNLQADNELNVRLAGAPGGRVTIVIDPASWTP
jgi:hypothetical protein